MILLKVGRYLRSCCCNCYCFSIVRPLSVFIFVTIKLTILSWNWTLINHYQLVRSSVLISCVANAATPVIWADLGQTFVSSNVIRRPAGRRGRKLAWYGAVRRPPNPAGRSRAPGHLPRGEWTSYSGFLLCILGMLKPRYSQLDEIRSVLLIIYVLFKLKSLSISSVLIVYCEI